MIPDMALAGDVVESNVRWDEAAMAARFAGLTGRLGGDASRAGDAFIPLQNAWSTPGRRYHDRKHLLECLRELDGAQAAPEVADVAEFALWYHDAVYDPRRRDSEERSATLLSEAAASLRIRNEAAFAAATCVRATAHLEGTVLRGPTIDLVVDVDLSILGRDAARFSEFEHAVAEEYAHVPALLYFVARGHFLAELLASPGIFRTARFRELYEESARANLRPLLDSPRYRTHRWFGGLYRRWVRRRSAAVT